MHPFIQDLDLNYLADRMVKKYQWSQETAQSAVQRYKNFLHLGLKYPEATLVPCADIDEVWHNHILHTKEYIRDCTTIFGSYRHHRPFNDTDNQLATKKMEDSYFLTAELYRKEFNEPYSLDMDIREFW